MVGLAPKPEILTLTSNSIKKAIIVCPVTLCENWKKEFRKWCVDMSEIGLSEALIVVGLIVGST